MVMVCIYCGSETRVTNSRPQKRSNTVWRRRFCSHCKATITSLEAVDYDRALRVRRTMSLEPFSRDKLFLSIYDSLKHRRNAVADATALTVTIISALTRKHKYPELDRTQIIFASGTILERFDSAAAIHYRAYHKP